MKLNPEQCYRAVQARDHRYDGLFFTGVHTTGIYCRCICPARTPKVESVRFYHSAVQAEAAGLRPCLRCRPESAPGSPAWSGTSSTVRHALRLIDQGQFFDDDSEGFAQRLGMSSRHLNRLFNEHVGISAGACGRIKRVQMAKSLLDQTSLPISQIAMSAGFQSIRRFNDAFKQSYGVAPSELRRSNRKLETDSDLVTLCIAYREPFSWDYFANYLGARCIRGVESIDRDSYQRMIELDDTPYHLNVAPDTESKVLKVSFPKAALSHTMTITEKVRDLFDLRCDVTSVKTRLCTDPRMKEQLERMELPRVPGCWDPFELGVRTIVGQQVSVAAATTIASRIAERLGIKQSNAPAGCNHLFPKPEILMNANLDGIGMPGKRIEALKQFSQSTFANELFSPGQDRDEFCQRLTTISGIGPWTAEYLAMRAFRDPNAFPASDLGVLKALSRGRDKQMKPGEAMELAKAWEPWRAYAVYTLWLSN